MTLSAIQNHRPIGSFIANYEDLDQIRRKWGKEWKERFEVGVPKATPKFSERKLIRKGLIGLYMRGK